MIWTFVWVVLWLNLGGSALAPELQWVMAMNESCDDPEFKTAAYHAALAKSDHADSVVQSDLWCDEVMAPDPPSKQPEGSVSN